LLLHLTDQWTNRKPEDQRLAKPADPMGILEALPNPRPFETLMDTFRAHAKREHLNPLAPERRAVVLELLKRLGSQ